MLRKGISFREKKKLKQLSCAMTSKSQSSSYVGDLTNTTYPHATSYLESSTAPPHEMNHGGMSAAGYFVSSRRSGMTSSKKSVLLNDATPLVGHDNSIQESVVYDDSSSSSSCYYSSASHYDEITTCNATKSTRKTAADGCGGADYDVQTLLEEKQEEEEGKKMRGGEDHDNMNSCPDDHDDIISATSFIPSTMRTQLHGAPSPATRSIVSGTALVPTAAALILLQNQEEDYYKASHPHPLPQLLSTTSSCATSRAGHPCTRTTQEKRQYFHDISSFYANSSVTSSSSSRSSSTCGSLSWKKKNLVLAQEYKQSAEEDIIILPDDDQVMMMIKSLLSSQEEETNNESSSSSSSVAATSIAPPPSTNSSSSHLQVLSCGQFSSPYLLSSPLQFCQPVNPPQCQPELIAIPKRQNLRHKPKQRKKFKTELCKYGRECKFYKGGLTCDFAHDASELKEKDWIDKSTYRKRPCSVFVATGACPMGDRCFFLHDQRIASPPSNNFWLLRSIDDTLFKRSSSISACCTDTYKSKEQKEEARKTEEDHETMKTTLEDNSKISTSHVDWHSHSKLSHDNNGHPFGNKFLLPAKFNPTFDDFYAAITNQNETFDNKLPLSRFQLLQIATKLRHDTTYSRSQSVYNYCDTHKLGNSCVCMLIQTRAFDVSSNLVEEVSLVEDKNNKNDDGKDDETVAIFCKKEINNNDEMKDNPPKRQEIIIVREIMFEPSKEDDCEDVDIALLFTSMNDEDFSTRVAPPGPTSPGKNNNDHDRRGPPPREMMWNTTSPSALSSDSRPASTTKNTIIQELSQRELKKINKVKSKMQQNKGSLPSPPLNMFHLCCPQDEQAYDLITEVLDHYCNALSCHPDYDDRTHHNKADMTIESISSCYRYKHLEKKFNSLLNHFALFLWPTANSRVPKEGFYGEDTTSTTPCANSEYRIMSSFNNPNKIAHANVWESFIAHLNTFSTRHSNLTHDAAVMSAGSISKKNDIHRRHRLNIFMKLADGISSSTTTTNEENINLPGIMGGKSASYLNELLMHWKLVKHTCDVKKTNRRENAKQTIRE